MSLGRESIENRVRRGRRELQGIARRAAKTQSDYDAARALEEELVLAERDYGRILGRATALPVNWPSRWSKNERIIDLRFRTESLLLVHETMGPARGRYSIAQCSQYVAYRVTRLSEDGFFQHHLYRWGLDLPGVYRVENSAWLDEVNTLNGCLEELSGKKPQHYLFLFEDSIAEFIANSIAFVGSVETREELKVFLEGA